MQDSVMQELQRPSKIDAATWRIGIVLGVVMVVSKLPFVLTTIGEQDQARMIVEAMIYAQDGAATVRPYGVFTSPLWLLSFSVLSKVMGAAALLVLSNVMGWLAGGATVTLGFVLLRQLFVPVVWSGVGAMALVWVPGAFYLSLYGYPSQFALPFLLAAASAFLACLDAPPHQQRRWFMVCVAAFTIFVLLKVDFVLAGSLLVSLAILRRRLLCRWTLFLPVMVLGVAVLYWLITMLAVRQSYFEFADTWSNYTPGRADAVLGEHSLTILYGCGWATLALWLLVLLASVFRPGHRMSALREAIAWVVATSPLWMFWLLRPPMSTRHALPGILVTVVFATLAASRMLPRPVWVAPLWLLAVLGGNAFFGSPGFDINYDPSGKLFVALQVNQRAYAVGTEVARAVCERRDSVKVIYGEADEAVFGGLDIHPLIEFAMACQSTEVRCRGQYGQEGKRHPLDLVFTGEDGHETQMFRVVDFKEQLSFQAVNTGFYAPWGTGNKEMRVPVMSFDPRQLYRSMRLTR